MRRLARPAVALTLLAAVLLLTAAFVGLAVQTNAIAREAAALRADIVAEQLRYAALEAQATEKKTDAYVVDRARDYGFVKPGEGLIAVERQRTDGAPAGPARVTSRLGRWLALFFGSR